MDNKIIEYLKGRLPEFISARNEMANESEDDWNYFNGCVETMQHIIAKFEKEEK